VTRALDDHDAVRRVGRGPVAATSWNRGAALATFIAVVPIAAVIFFVMGRHQWFFLDEWDFLVTRRAGSLHDLLRPHNEHWSTLPILVYRALWHSVGLRSYRPYQVLVIGVHLTVGVLLRAVMRRSGVSPWIATAAASLFVLLGSGDQDIVWAFQIGYVGAVAFGLIDLLLAVHDGPIGRRDWFGLAAGLAALLCSGVAVTMVVVVAIATLVQRGWRAALFHTVPLGVVYGAWFLTFGHKGVQSHGTTLHEFVSFLSGAISASFRGMGQHLGVSIALAVMLVVGILMAAFDGTVAERRHRLAMPGALLFGALVYLAISAVGRPNTIFTHEADRYVHVTAALAMPAIAVAADAFVRRWRFLLPAAMFVLLAGVPGNIRALRVHNIVDRGSKELMLTLPRVAMAKEVPRDTRPQPVLAPEVTIGWLLDGVAEGRVPPPPKSDPTAPAVATLTLALDQRRSDSPPSHCRTVLAPAVRRLIRGEGILFENGPLAVSVVVGDSRGSLSFFAGNGNLLVARATVSVSVASASARYPATICN
jgi:hypothetical protein